MAERCECGHPVTDHKLDGLSPFHALRGKCFAPLCACRGFVQAKPSNGTAVSGGTDNPAPTSHATGEANDAGGLYQEATADICQMASCGEP